MRPRWMGSLLVVAALAGCGGSNASPSPTAAPKRTPVARTDVAAVAARADVPVLCYHQIRPLRALDSASARPYIVSPGALARQMQALADAGYHTARGEQLGAHGARGAPLPLKAGAPDLRRRVGRPVQPRAAGPAPPPLRRDVLRHDRGARQARVAHPPSGARARPRRDDDRRPHLGPPRRAAVLGL